jgi:hypothetical protein
VASETADHRELKRLALIWARAQRYTIAAPEVSLPHLRCRLDVAAYRPDSKLERSPTGRRVRVTTMGTTAGFECKQTRADFLIDSRRSAVLTDRLERLHARKARHELRLRLHYPSLRNGDSLFAEYETHDFQRSGDELYLKLLQQMRCASRQLHEETKFEKLCRWGAVNLHYVVTKPGVLRPHELPDGWGLLVQHRDALELVVKPIWRDIPESARLRCLQQIAVACGRGANRPLVDLPHTPVGITPPGGPTPSVSFQK